jgi:hypothetical protein
MPDHATGDPQVEMHVLLRCLSPLTRSSPQDAVQASMKDLREKAGNCPACILAAIRQSRLAEMSAETDDEGFRLSGLEFEFDFKAEMKSYWDEVNTAEAEAYAERYTQW